MDEKGKKEMRGRRRKMRKLSPPTWRPKVEFLAIVTKKSHAGLIFWLRKPVGSHGLEAQ
jgi:hypothetical protein